MNELGRILCAEERCCTFEADSHSIEVVPALAHTH